MKGTARETRHSDQKRRRLCLSEATILVPGPISLLDSVAFLVRFSCRPPYLSFAALSVAPYKYRQSCKLTDYGENDQRHEGSIVEEPHRSAADKPRYTKPCIKQTKPCAAFRCRNHTGQQRFQKRILCAHADAPKDHTGEYEPEVSEKYEGSKHCTC